MAVGAGSAGRAGCRLGSGGATSITFDAVHVIGTDGGMAKPYDADHLLVAPGERYDVMLRAPTTPGPLELRTLPYDRGHDSGQDPTLVVAKILVEGAPVSAPAPLPTSGRALAALPAASVVSPIVLDEKSLPSGEVVFTINGQTAADVPPLKIAKGEVRGLRIRNDSEMDHPFHLHGFFFQVVRRNDVPVAAGELVDKDTIVVPKKSSLEVVARFDEPGMWMYHCHILEHAENGMMGMITVE